ncbi:MAG: hypothetical protein COT91_01225 [Candidatus Doudnabacteria bacterium CG10_big_fil_rev_8_21_14_0_10_41_10]|uniref:Uncharacterized protein n=1 Tax=Candidatus Doudnabacteria bacterium CG10_big_fil_rev_8_21_14_0_10_41_10 TaxID=1974551 RepID=A0A2H0VEE2_9BACT|nr:MAG: hypothetical protein COT91_01225 [Candidatus Doudnabacteria bacterium CG10_big_fil_rev_8_21_14_0_10_41_10]
MLQTPIKAFLIVVLVLVVIGFILAVAQSPSEQGTQVSINPVDEPLVLGHTYFAGANTYSGSFMTPTPCYDWGQTDVELSDTKPEKIKLVISAQEVGDCVDVKTPAKKDFTFLVPSSPDAGLVGVELNGKEVKFEIRKD